MDRMSKFTLLRAVIGISSLKIYPIKKEVRKYYNPLTSNRICRCLFSIFRQKYGVNGLYELPLCTKMCTKLARLVLY